MNQSIRRFGFCFLLENYTYDRNATPVSAYCDAPGKMAYEHSPPAATAIASMRFHVPKPSSGIFYRPKAPYQLQVYTKHYPDDRGEWELSYTKKFEMENIMPVISVGIGRAVFATRRTGLVFDNGLLANVCIAKGSEIAGAIEIPLDIIYGLVALPGEIIRATYNDAETRRDLIRAETELINAQKEYIDFLNSQTKAQAVTKKPSTLSLGTPNDRRAPPGTDPVDPGSIVGSDALKDICPQLMAAKSLPGKGNF
jgi:hypothetical protein